MPIAKQRRMFNSVVLLVFSWGIAFSGALAGAYLLLFYPKNPELFLKGAAVIFSCLVLAAAVRMLANIGQLIFETKTIAQELSIRNYRDMARLLDANGRLLYEVHEIGEEAKVIGEGIKGLHK
ncbi:MAG: hypothetical protein WCJ71_00780 [Candidatus Omnitrophota bacterium]